MPDTGDNPHSQLRSFGDDANGRAALLLVESLIHGLIEKSVLSVSEAVEIVETASQVANDTGLELGGSEASVQKSLGLLLAISQSLRSDIAKS